jgi:hypothetical protein
MTLSFLAPLLARNEEINKWLGENPAVLGGLFFVIGLVLLGFGIKDLVTGKARGKWGTEMTGGMASVMGIVRLVAGVGCVGFGAYKLIQAVL